MAESENVVAILSSVDSVNYPSSTSTIVPKKYWPHGILVDARLQETYNYQAEATQHAVESGVVFSDHVILRPVRVDLSFEVTNFGGVDKPTKALTDAVLIWARRMVKDLVTQHRVMKNMLCISIQADNSVPEWGRLAFRATFQQIKFVSLQTVKYPSSQVKGAVTATGGPATGNSAQSPSSSGTQTPKQVVKPASKAGIFKAGGGSFSDGGATEDW